MAILLILGILILLWLTMKNYKQIKMGNLILVTGGVKTGKSTLSVWLAIKKHKEQIIKWNIYNFFGKLFKGKKFKKAEKPLLYSNVPLNCDHVELTKEVLLREKRVNFKSVIYIQEASLIADSMLFKDYEFNEKISYFNKLIGHETHGGYLIYDTQQVADLHFGIKRNINNYIYIHNCIKWIPFVIVLKLKENRYSYDNSSIETNEKDIEDTMKTIVLSKSIWKMFDCYSYSEMTDNLEVEKNITNGKKLKNLKTKNILTFKEKKNKEKQKNEEIQL